MKVTKIQLRRIIREEKRRILEDCGGDPAALDMAPVAVEPAPVALAENMAPEQELVVEMEVAQRSLEQVVESVQAAAALCPNCGPGVAVQAPLVEAMVAQAEALQETLQAQLDVVAESAEGLETLDVVDMVADLV
jgi:capsule polysaccharide export protein KpsE/RkpR